MFKVTNFTTHLLFYRQFFIQPYFQFRYLAFRCWKLSHFSFRFMVTLHFYSTNCQPHHFRFNCYLKMSNQVSHLLYQPVDDLKILFLSLETQVMAECFSELNYPNHEHQFHTFRPLFLQEVFGLNLKFDNSPD